MTAAERAEKIVAQYTEFRSPDEPLLIVHESIVTGIAAQIEEAEREAVNKTLIALEQGVQNQFHFERGFSAAKEKAKGICDPCGYSDCKHERCSTADRIGEMEP